MRIPWMLQMLRMLGMLQMLGMGLAGDGGVQEAERRALKPRGRALRQTRSFGMHVRTSPSAGVCVCMCVSVRV